MPLIKVIRHGQITLPAFFRKELALKEGDYLEAELKQDMIILRPKVVLDRTEALAALHRIMDAVQDRTQGVDAEVIEGEVSEAIEAVRRTKRDA